MNQRYKKITKTKFDKTHATLAKERTFEISNKNSNQALIEFYQALKTQKPDTLITFHPETQRKILKSIHKKRFGKSFKNDCQNPTRDRQNRGQK